MWVALLMLVPTGLALGLLAFGHYGRRDVRPTPRSLATIATLAVLTGPVAVVALGFLTWMLLVGVAVGLLTMAALLRTPRTPLGG